MAGRGCSNTQGQPPRRRYPASIWPYETLIGAEGIQEGPVLEIGSSHLPYAKITYLGDSHTSIEHQPKTTQTSSSLHLWDPLVTWRSGRGPISRPSRRPRFWPGGWPRGSGLFGRPRAGWPIRQWRARVRLARIGPAMSRRSFTTRTRVECDVLEQDSTFVIDDVLGVIRWMTLDGVQ